MTPDTFIHALQQGLGGLDRQVAHLTRELASLAAAKPADPDVIAAAVARAQQAAEAVGSGVAEAAAAVGDPPPVWNTREELDAIVAGLTERLRILTAGLRRARLRKLAESLLRGSVIHPRWRKVVPALDAVRVQAASQVQAAADADDPPDLPGQCDGNAWLTWAWNLSPDQVEDTLHDVRTTIPALAEVVLEIDPSHWVTEDGSQESGDRSQEEEAEPDEAVPVPEPMSESVPVAEVIAAPREALPDDSDGPWIEDEARVETPSSEIDNDV